MKHLVLCPGSRSGPLALAAGSFADRGQISLVTAIDERSAAFFALGLSTATGKATAVVTTSGTAVAHLLPAAVEADRSCQPLLFLTADRPSRLKDCGANQTVNQQDFLKPVCRLVQQGPTDGFHLVSANALNDLVEKSWESSHQFAGPVHINLPFEEPLHATRFEQEEVLTGWIPGSFRRLGSINHNENIDSLSSEVVANEFFSLNPSCPGVVLVGPWRGPTNELAIFQKALAKWQLLSGWPVMADPLSGISFDQPGLIFNWELLLTSELFIPEEGLQVLRLGPMPTSRCLEVWFQKLGGNHLVVTEGDGRNLDPLGVSIQWSGGFAKWLELFLRKTHLEEELPSEEVKALFSKWKEKDQLTQSWLDKKLPLRGPVNEPSLARWLPRLLPEGIPIMLAASSPIRDWLSFSSHEAFSRRVFSFRGASGIDGTLSLAMGLSMALGQMVLVTGDLALLHDSNGWLFSYPRLPQLVVLLIDNGGGGIFQQLHLETASKEKFDQLFAMPQVVDQLALAEAHRIPYRQVSCLEDLEIGLEWGLSQSGPVLIRVCTHPEEDMNLRRELRNGVANYVQSTSHNGFSGEEDK